MRDALKGTTLIYCIRVIHPTHYPGFHLNLRRQEDSEVWGKAPVSRYLTAPAIRVISTRKLLMSLGNILLGTSSLACLRRKAPQRCDGGPARRTIYFATVVCQTFTSSFQPLAGFGRSLTDIERTPDSIDSASENHCIASS
jgi:hypothetical protein